MSKESMFLTTSLPKEGSLDVITQFEKDRSLDISEDFLVKSHLHLNLEQWTRQ